MLPLTKLKPFYPGQLGIPGSDNPLGLRLLPGAQVFFVQSIHASANNSNDGTDPDFPLATLQQAITNAVTARGDIIVLGPGHVQAVIAAGTITINKANLTIVGVGNGASRPTFNFTTNVAASILITAANVRIENILCIAGIDGLTNPLHLQAADCSLINIEWRDVTDVEALRAILTTAAADRLLIDGFLYDGFVTGNACLNAMRLVGVDQFEIKNSRFLGNFGTGIIEFHTTASTKGSIHDCVFMETGATSLAVNVVTTGAIVCSWVLFDCFDVPSGIRFNGGSGRALSTMSVPMVVEKVDGTCPLLIDPLFTIAGGSILVTEFYGLVTTVIGNNVSTCLIQLLSTAPAATVAISTAVAIDTDAVGTTYTFSAAAPSVLTPNTSGILNPVPLIRWLLTAGEIQATFSAANSGAIRWFMTYIPLSPGVTVVAAP